MYRNVQIGTLKFNDYGLTIKPQCVFLKIYLLMLGA